MDKGIHKFRALRSQIVAGAEVVIVAVEALTHIRNEDRGMRALHSCEHAAMLCEARLATMRKAERTVRRVLAAKLLDTFKPLFHCTQVGLLPLVEEAREN